jgi:translation initiation factor 3 subunit L
MYALYTICTTLSPSRLDDNIANIAKERYGENLALQAIEENFLYACPKFISANPLDAPAEDPTRRHLGLFLTSCAAYTPVPALKTLLKLYTSIDCGKLAGFMAAKGKIHASCY